MPTHAQKKERQKKKTLKTRRHKEGDWRRVTEVGGYRRVTENIGLRRQTVVAKDKNDMGNLDKQGDKSREVNTGRRQQKNHSNL